MTPCPFPIRGSGNLLSVSWSRIGVDAGMGCWVGFSPTSGGCASPAEWPQQQQGISLCARKATAAGEFMMQPIKSWCLGSKRGRPDLCGGGGCGCRIRRFTSGIRVID